MKHENQNTQKKKMISYIYSKNRLNSETKNYRKKNFFSTNNHKCHKTKKFGEQKIYMVPLDRMGSKFVKYLKNILQYFNIILYSKKRKHPIGIIF